MPGCKKITAPAASVTAFTFRDWHFYSNNNFCLNTKDVKDLQYHTIKKSRKVLMVMKAAKLDLAGPGAGQKQGRSGPGAKKEQGSSRSRGGVG